MASLKDTFAKGITTLNVTTNNFMEENKCKTYISTLEEEIKNLKCRLGELVYKNRENMSVIQGEIQQISDEISGKYTEIQVQENKIRQLAETKQQILGTPSGNMNMGVNMNAGQNMSPNMNAGANMAMDVVYCSQCGHKNNAQYRFCAKCGNPLT